ncbi:MAG: PD40 domain-containing protein [Ignavibacteriae bacterium]|nr:PD40 domain-containing protein [Ignavibacteriota bacterium]
MIVRGRLILVLMAGLFILPLRVFAQDGLFGKNKVQYTQFNWYFIQTDHFDIYFSDGGEKIAEFTATAIETAYTSISKSFRYQIVNRIPIIVTNSHNDFQQNNVVSEYLEEGIGGVTELFKNRVLIPFEGNYKQFRHVIHHELVHAVLNDMFYGGSIQSIIANNITLQLPLWFNEGIAEYEAQRWETDSDMFLRDATVHEYLPPINRLYGYFAYRGGQSLWWYIANKYGQQKIGDILNRIKSTRSVEAGFRGALGLGLEELSERWQKEMKVTYWPDIAKREEPADYARRLTDHKKDGNFYNTSPALSPQGDKLAFISDRSDYLDVFLMNTIDGKVTDKIVDGQQTNDFEELKLLTPRVTWSPDGKKIALAAKAGAQDAILMVDVEEGDAEKLTFDLNAIYSVDWSPQGDKLAFVGNRLHQSDIYVYDLNTKTLKNLTGDIYSDSDPAFSADGKSVFFASDRGSNVNREKMDMAFFDFSQRDLYRVDVESAQVQRLTQEMESDENSVVASPDGKKLLYISDKNGINNIYEYNLETRKSRPITNSLSGVYQLSLSRDGTKLAFSSLNYAGFDIFLMRNPFERELKMTELEPTEFLKSKSAPIVAAKIDTVAVAPKPAPQDSSGLYGKDIQIDFSAFAAHDERPENLPTDSTVARMPKIAGNMDSEGKYKINKYKLNFSPDIIYGNAGYNTFYGVTGSTVMAFSDLLGNHQIIFVTNLLLDLKNSDYGLQYLYLPNRIDYGFSAFHSARFVIVNSSTFGQPYLYRFRTYGAGLAAQYPIDKFNRVDFGLSWYNISRENLDRIDEPTQKRTVLVPSIGYTHDNSLWGFTAPVNGTRYSLNIFGTPKLGSAGLSFVNVVGDYRTYLRLGRNYSIALRLAGGGSFGGNPQKFIIGGVDNWINRTFEGDYVPLDRAEDYVFLQTGLPLRGYNYNAAIGSRYGLFNFEFRYPLFAFLQAGPLPIGLQSIGGAMFFDMGAAWNKEREFRAFRQDADGNTITDDLLMGMGTGARIYFLAFLVRLDVAWAWYWNGFSEPKYYISLGADF